LNIIKTKGQYNDKTIANCSVALTFIAAYVSDPAQQTELFDQYENTLVLQISIPIKFGLLLNGHAGLNRVALLANLESHMKDNLKDLTGV
jgi:hypothetical protein